MTTWLGMVVFTARTLSAKRSPPELLPFHFFYRLQVEMYCRTDLIYWITPILLRLAR